MDNDALKEQPKVDTLTRAELIAALEQAMTEGREWTSRYADQIADRVLAALVRALRSEKGGTHG